MAERRGQGAEQIEGDETQMAHGVLDVVAEDPEEEQVTDQMHPVAVEEGRSEEGQQRRDALQLWWQALLSGDDRRADA